MANTKKSKQQLIQELEELQRINKELQKAKATPSKTEIPIWKEEEITSAVISHSPIGVSVRSKNGTLLMANEAWQKLWKIPDERMQQDKIPRTAPNVSFDKRDDYLGEHRSKIKEVYEIGGEYYIPEIKPLRPMEGKAEWISQRFYAIKDKQGKVDKVVVLTEDITHRKKAEEALKESEQKLREANAAKDKFFSIIAHDLKGPLSIIAGYASVLSNLMENLDKAQLKEYIKKINDSAQNVQNLLKNLLDWSGSRAGRIPYLPSKINLKRTVDDTIALLTPLATNKKIQLESQIDENIFVYADNNMISSVLRNLISNALKFTYPGGDINIQLQNKEHFVIIAVIDNGMGIEADIIKNLFKVGGKSISTSGTQNEKGTGLGLILCREFIEKNGGEIWIESNVGKGSRFCFTLPKEKQY